jgi:hypothetical protein
MQYALIRTMPKPDSFPTLAIWRGVQGKTVHRRFSIGDEVSQSNVTRDMTIMIAMMRTSPAKQVRACCPYSQSRGGGCFSLFRQLSGHVLVESQ